MWYLATGPMVTTKQPLRRQTCYATNYFDTRGVDALQAFWEEHYLNDPELNEKIKRVLYSCLWTPLS